MSFPRYPKYKDSGVEWLGEVPEHWVVVPLKAVASHNDEVLAEDTPTDHEIAYVDISGVAANVGITTKESMAFAAAPSRARRKVRHGDVIVSTVRTYLRAIARIVHPEDNLVVSTGFAVIRPRSTLCAEFVGYMLSANYFIEQVIARSTGVSYPAINASELVAIPALLPPPNEQPAIASFLDLETAKIDALIAEQQRLIELLQEKRQAVISHAVTKGLNPDAPMKDSGIEWLGEVPEHWEAKPVRHACYINNTLRTPIDKQTRSDIEGEYPYYGPTGVLSWIDKYVADGEFFLLGEDGDHFLKYKTQSMTVNVSGRFNVNNHAHLMRGKGNCSTHWASLFFEHKDLLPWLIKQGVGRYKLRKETLVTIPILVPPPEEQERIRTHSYRVKEATSCLIAEAQQTTTILQERRSALISAAVTGQIDVRNHSSEGAAA